MNCCHCDVKFGMDNLFGTHFSQWTTQRHPVVSLYLLLHGWWFSWIEWMNEKQKCRGGRLLIGWWLHSQLWNLNPIKQSKTDWLLSVIDSPTRSKRCPSCRCSQSACVCPVSVCQPRKNPIPLVPETKKGLPPQQECFYPQEISTGTTSSQDVWKRPGGGNALI